MTDTIYYGDMNFTSYTTKARMAGIVHLLNSDPHGLTFDQLAQLANMHSRTLQAYVSHMHKVKHAIHIGGWILPASGKAVKVYRAGDKPDADRPSVNATDACFLNQHPLHVSRRKSDDDALPVRRVFSKWTGNQWVPT
jgi:hypothetical protein